MCSKVDCWRVKRVLENLLESFNRQKLKDILGKDTKIRVKFTLVFTPEKFRSISAGASHLEILSVKYLRKSGKVCSVETFLCKMDK